MFTENDDKITKSIGKPRQHGAYAYFPGTGPKGAACKSCDHCNWDVSRYAGSAGRQKAYCAKWVELRSPHDKLSIQKVPAIDPSTAACKYYIPRPQRFGRG